MLNEIGMKIRLVTHLMQTHPDAILASEVRYCFGERRADVVMLEAGCVYAFEIKSARDSTRRLGYQIESYRQFFDFCTVVCEPENLERIQSELEDDIGLWCVGKEGEIFEKKQAAKQITLNPLVLASVLPVRKLRRLVKHSARPESSTQVDFAHLLAASMSIEALRALTFDFLVSEYEAGFKALRRDQGEVLTGDDILLITERFPEILRD